MIDSKLLIELYIFVLAVFVGFEVITKVPPTLHTPLMSGANAISGIAVIGALIVTGQDSGMAGSVLGVLAVALAALRELFAPVEKVARQALSLALLVAVVAFCVDHWDAVYGGFQVVSGEKPLFSWPF